MRQFMNAINIIDVNANQIDRADVDGMVELRVRGLLSGCHLGHGPTPATTKLTGTSRFKPSRQFPATTLRSYPITARSRGQWCSTRRTPSRAFTPLA